MNTVETGVGSPSGVTSDAQGNIYFPYFGYIYYVQAGTTGLSAVNVSGAGGLYPFSQSIVALNSDVSGDLFVAVQNPLNSPTNGPYVQVYELLQGSSGYTWGGLVASPSGSTPPPLNGGTYSTLNSMAYDNLNGFLYLNYFTGPEGQQVITCINAVSPFTGYTTSGSTTVTVSSTSGLFPGQVINSAGPQIPAGDTIASVGAGTITLTVAATATTNSFGTTMNIVPAYGCGSINQFTSPLNDTYGNGLAVDGAGNVYTTYGTSSGYIAQFPPGFSGAGRTYSTASTGFGGNVIAYPGITGLVGLAADDAGQVFIDAGAAIYYYSPAFNSSGTPTGFFTHVAGVIGTNGLAVNGYNGDNGTAILLEISGSEGVTLDPSGDLWIADTGNGRIREISGAGIGEGAGTGAVASGGSPTFGCLQCGPQSLGNGRGGVGGFGNSAPTDTIQTNHFSNLTLLDSNTHKLYVAYGAGVAVFSTSNDTVQTSGGLVDFISLAPNVTQMVLDSTKNVIWAVSAGQVLSINSNSALDTVTQIALPSGGAAQTIAVDSKLNQVYVAYYLASSRVPYDVAVIAGSNGTITTTLPLQGPAQALVADSAHGVAYLVAQDPYTLCTYCAQYNYDMVVINGTTANKGTPIEITSTTTLIEGSEYSSGITHSSLAVDPNTGKVVLADAVDTYFSLYNPAEPSYEAVDHVNLGWIPFAVSIDTANSIAYLSDSQYNNVQAIGVATVLANTAYGWSYNLFSGTQGSNNCGFLSNAVVPDPTTGEVYIITCTVNTTNRTANSVLNLLEYTGFSVNGTTLTPNFGCGFGAATCPPLDTYTWPANSSQPYGFYDFAYTLNVDTSNHSLYVGNYAGDATGSDILVFNGLPYPPAARPQQTLNTTTFAFTNAGLGMQQRQTLGFTNNGTASMLDPVITFSGTNAADFSYVDGCTGGVPASGGTCPDTITFTPSVLGSESATALVVDNSPDLPQTLTLSGTGVLPTGSGHTTSSTLLQVSALQVAPGAALTLYATISPAISSGGEQVLFLDNNTTPVTVLGTGTALGGSVWTLSTTTLAAGTHALTAYYAGDATYAPSTSSTVNVVISSSGTGPSQPLLSFTPGSFYVSNPQSGTDNFSDIALDSAGDEFVLDSGVGSVTEYPVGGSKTTYVDAGVYDQGSLMNHPSGLAVAPGGGTVYITDTQNNHIATATLPNSAYVSPMEIYGLGACIAFGTPTSFASLYSPTGISIGPPSSTSSIPNSAGYDLYVADSGNKRVLEINPVGGNTSACGYYPGGVVVAILAGTGSPSGPALNDPLSVAASGSNVYIVDAPPAITNPSLGSGTIYKNGTAIANTGQIVFPYSVATDAAGDLYFSDQSLSQVWRIDTQGNFLAVAGNGLNNAGSSCTSAAPCEATQTSVVTPYGLAISGNGSIYVGDAVATGQVGEVNVTTGMLTFPGQSTSTTSSPLTVTVTDTASMAVGASGASLAGTNMADFAILTGVSGGTCNTTTGFTLSPGHSCTILVTFTPGATGTRTAVIDLTTQSDIYGGTVQQIQLTGNGAAPGLLPQTIAFPPPPRPVVYGAGADALSATASSSLSVSYSVSGPGVLSGNSVRFAGVGLVKIVASQAGNGSYAAATSVEQDITVLQAPLIVTTPPATRVYEAQDPVFPVSIAGFIAPDTQASIVTGSPTFTVASGDYGDAPVGTILTVNTGLGNLALSSSNYAFSLVPSTLTVVCCESQSFVPASLPPANFPIPVGATYYLTVSATSGLPVSYAVLSGPGTTATTALGPTLTATGTGTITVQLSQTGNTNISAATPITLTFVGH
jgi:hypothetical protein